MSAVTRLRAVLDDLERIGWSEECSGIEVLAVLSDGRESSQRARRRRLDARAWFALAVDAHPELGIEWDLTPESITALEAVDPEAAAAFRWEVGFEEWRQVVFVTGEKTVRLYVDGRYAYTVKVGSSLLLDRGVGARRWEIVEWRGWALADVTDIAPSVLEEHPELAEAWRRVTAGSTETEERYAVDGSAPLRIPPREDGAG